MAEPTGLPDIRLDSTQLYREETLTDRRVGTLRRLVPVTADGGLTFEDGISAPGKYVELKALMNTTVLISNCPQLNNPCNGYNPTPIEVLIW